MGLETITEKLFDLEKMFRELTTDLQLERASWYDVSKRIERGSDELFKIADMARNVAASEYAEEDDRFIAERLAEIVDRANELLIYLDKRKDECMREGLSPRKCTIDMKYVIKLENAVRGLTGSACAWKVSNTFTSALNDLAACLHRAAERTAQGLEWKVDGKCSIAPKSSSEAIELCRTWDKMTELLNKNGLYSSGDYEELHGWTVGDRVYLRVGSSAGHRTEVDLKEGTLKYYDTDDNVNEMMKESLERHAGLSCNVISGIGVECKGITKENLRRVAEVIAFATSMDLRLGSHAYYIRTVAEHSKEFEKLLAK